VKTAQAVPVLMYHHISPVTQGLATSPANFASQMRWLAKHGWTTLSGVQLQGFLQAGEPVPVKSLVLTFDDGYLDNWQYAHPVLQHYGLHALMFLVTDWISQGPLRDCATLAQIESNRLDGFEHFSHAACKQRIEQGQADRVIVRQSEINAMCAADTFEFHSHTHTHARWDKVATDVTTKRAGLRDDLLASRAVFDSQCAQGATPHLCWPQGYVDQDYRDVAKQLGFTTFYTTDSSGLNRPGQGVDHIYRFAVRNRGGWLFGQRVMLAASPKLGGLYNRIKHSPSKSSKPSNFP